jgi:predicted dehydrogenase
MAFRFGLIGTGIVAETHLEAIRSLPDVEVAAVADIQRERADAFARRYGIANVYGSAEEMVAAAPIDAVDILTPHNQHLPAARVAAKGGKHVLIEKAMAESVRAATEIIDVCESNNVILGGIFQNRFCPASRAMKEVVDEGALGKKVLISVTTMFRRSNEYYAKAAWRGRKQEAGGGVLMMQGIHTVDLLQWVVGMPARVFALVSTASHPIKVEDLAVALLQWEDGASGVLQATTSAVPEVPQELEVRGDKGTAGVFDSRGYLGFWCSTVGKPVPLTERWALYAANFHEQEATVPIQASTQPHAENIADFVSAVRAQRGPLVSGREARKALLIVDALYRSSELGDWVDVNPGN